MQTPHIPVLLDEVLSAFGEISNGVVVDCTLGYAGHSSAILQRFGDISLIGCDKDNEAIAFSAKRLEKFGDRVQIFKSAFGEILPKIDTKNVRGILADIGVSSLQLDKNERGFGLKSQKLDMRMDQNSKISAYDVVNGYSQEELARILRDYGELANANLIATKIVNKRRISPIDSCEKLANLIGLKNLNGRSVSMAVLAFQAIRIEVNSELAELENLLDCIENSDIDDCVVAIIAFHSLEDRIVKNRFKKWASNCICPQDSLRCMCGNNHAIGKIINKKPIVASETEIKLNSRSGCAKMRVFKILRGANAR